jgi:hypothetical protein
MPAGKTLLAGYNSANQYIIILTSAGGPASQKFNQK